MPYRTRWMGSESVCGGRKPDFVLCDHLSNAIYPKPAPFGARTDRPRLPILSCSGRGLPCPLDFSRGGGLLHRLFTLIRFPQAGIGRFIFCGTFHPLRSSRGVPALQRDILPYGVRTFLPGAKAPERSLAPAARFSKNIGRWITVSNKAFGRKRCTCRSSAPALHPG